MQKTKKKGNKYTRVHILLDNYFLPTNPKLSMR